MLAILLLFLATLVGINAQGCTIETARNATVLSIISRPEVQNNIINSNETIPNCLVTSIQRGTYISISMSVRYTKSANDSEIEEERFYYVCHNDIWFKARNNSNASYLNDTRSNCSSCTDTTVNDYHCTR